MKRETAYRNLRRVFRQLLPWLLCLCLVLPAAEDFGTSGVVYAAGEYKTTGNAAGVVVPAEDHGIEEAAPAPAAAGRSPQPDTSAGTDDSMQSGTAADLEISTPLDTMAGQDASAHSGTSTPSDADAAPGMAFQQGQGIMPSDGSAEKAPDGMAIDEPAAQNLNDASGDLSKFLKSIEICDADGNIVEAKDMKTGVEYTVKLKFADGTDLGLLFRPATKEELKAAGIPESAWEDADWDKGEWMYVELGEDIVANLGDLTGNDDVKFVQDENGKTFILYRWKGETAHEYDIEFKGQIKEDTDLKDIEIVGGTESGNYTPPHTYDPAVKKEAGAYDPETHHIPYTVTVTNPQPPDGEPGEPLDIYSVLDEFLNESFSEDEQPELVDGSIQVKIGDQTIDVEIVKNPDGSFTLNFPGAPVQLAPGSELTITYELDVTKHLQGSVKEEGSFKVDNEVTVTVGGDDQGEREELKDEESKDVVLGELKKSGYKIKGTFYKYVGVIQWDIEVYDPYSELDGTTITDILPNASNGGTGTLGFGDIIGVAFEYEDGYYLQYVKDQGEEKFHIATPGMENGNFPSLGDIMKQSEENGYGVDFKLSSPAISEEYLSYFFKDQEHHRIHIRLYTKLPRGENGEIVEGDYHNHVKAVLPSEGVEREAEANVNVGPPGVELEKEGHLNLDGKKLDYTITMHVNPDIKEGAYYGVGAMVDDMMSIKIGENDVYMDVDDALSVESVIAVYDDDEKGSDQEWEFTTDGEEGHKYGVYPVIRLGDDEKIDYYRIIEGKDSSTTFNHETMIVFNPEVKVLPDDYSKWTAKWRPNIVTGHWPNELASRDVTLTIHYTIDPAKAYFLAPDRNHKQPLQVGEAGKADTLAEYLELNGDVIVHNHAIGAVKDSYSTKDEDVNLTVPLTKDGEAHFDIETNERIATYTVTFHNGVDNDSAIPKNARNIVFKDQFEADKMEYVAGSLSAVCEYPDGRTERFKYAGVNPPVTGSTITASWSDFWSVNGGNAKTLQDDFNAQEEQYWYVFTYQLKARSDVSIPQDSENKAKMQVDNKAWMEFAGDDGILHPLKPVEKSLEFPTGVLTKEAALENGRISFYVEVNEQAADLSPADDTLTVEDTATTHGDLRLVPDSIRVEEFKNGEWVELEEGVQLSIDGDGGFTLTVPDEKQLLIRYEYELTEQGKKKDNVEIGNKVTINGQEAIQDEVKRNFSTQAIKDTIRYDHAVFKIRKVREDDPDSTVAGARFVLYARSIGIHNTEKAELEAEKIDKPTLTQTAEGKEFIYYPSDIYETGPDGIAEVDSTLLMHDQVYGLVESFVPDGYTRLKEPIFFKIEQNTEDEFNPVNKVVILDGNGQEITAHTGPVIGQDDIMTVSNPYQSSELRISKIVTGSAGEKEKLWTFEIQIENIPIGVYRAELWKDKELSDFTGRQGNLVFENGITNVTFTSSGNGVITSPPNADRDILADHGVYIVTGMATVQLKHGQTLRILGLPDNVRYQVTEIEADQDGYTTSSTGETGTVPKNGMAEAKFVNSKPEEPETPPETSPEEPHETPPETPHETRPHTPQETPYETPPETSPETWYETTSETVQETMPAESGTVPPALKRIPDEGESPYTGDSRHPLFWLAVMGLSMAAALFSFWQIRKIARSEKRPGRSRKRRRRW